MVQSSVVIVGGGVIGAASAYYLAREHGTAVTVLERDPTFARASSSLSASSIRQQFSTPVNIALSRASLALMRPWLPRLSFVEAGYLYLATEAGAGALHDVHTVQRACGADVRLLDRDALAERWPWLSVGDLALGSWGASGEGWFDGPGLHQLLRHEAALHGVRFVAAQALGFDTSGPRVTAVVDTQGERHAAEAFVIAAGAWSAPLAARLGYALPVTPKKRDVFVLASPAALPGCPLLIDPSGVWLRPEGRHYLAGAPPRDADPDEPPLEDIDHGLFDAVIWPTLAARIPAFEALRVRSAWAGYYEMNAFDHNAVIGTLPGWTNAHIACGFSGHGMQHALAVGAGLARWIAQQRWDKVDLTPLSPQRLLRNQALHEANII